MRLCGGVPVCCTPAQLKTWRLKPGFPFLILLIFLILTELIIWRTKPAVALWRDTIYPPLPQKWQFKPRSARPRCVLGVWGSFLLLVWRKHGHKVPDRSGTLDLCASVPGCNRTRLLKPNCNCELFNLTAADKTCWFSEDPDTIASFSPSWHLPSVYNSFVCHIIPHLICLIAFFFSLSLSFFCPLIKFGVSKLCNGINCGKLERLSKSNTWLGKNNKTIKQTRF